MKKRYEPYTKLKAFLDENDISQKYLAALLGLSRTTVNLKLNGSGTDFMNHEVRKICREFGISADEFFIEPKVS